MLLLRQIRTLIWKNVLLTLIRHPLATILRAFVLPLAFALFLCFVQQLIAPPATYGIGTSRPLQSFTDVLKKDLNGHQTLAFVKNGIVSNDMDQVIAMISNTAILAGKDVQILDSDEALSTICRTSLRGISGCLAAVVFHAAPTNYSASWNYTLRFDSALGRRIDVTSSDNDQQVYVLPLQYALDSAMASRLHEDFAYTETVFEYPYTSMTQKERDDQIRTNFMTTIINIIALAFFITMCGVSFHLSGSMASERESQMAQLMDCMMPNPRRWEPQVARLLSFHVSFSMIYLPGWIAAAVTFALGLFRHTSATILIFTHIFAGLSVVSASICGAAFFRRSQLSGIVVLISFLLLAVIAQFVKASTSTVVILSLLFPPANYTYLIILFARFESAGEATSLIKIAPGSPNAVAGISLWALLIIQIFGFLALSGAVERSLWETTKSQNISHSKLGEPVLKLSMVTKQYHSRIYGKLLAKFGRKYNAKTAVDKVSMTVLQGQIVVLLGANGSGKSSTLNIIAGLISPTSGTIKISNSRGTGHCPQQNVHFRELSVKENLEIFRNLKSDLNVSKTETSELAKCCDLGDKLEATAGNLSGGQMRKLQLCMMFIGGSSLCLVDEFSSGVDTLARRRLQEIILAERKKSNISIIMTTHFLDEADRLCDQLCIMSKGSIKVCGTGPEVKETFGNGYRVSVKHGLEPQNLPDFPGITKTGTTDQTIYGIATAASVSQLLDNIDRLGYLDYQISGPTIEDVFMRVAEEMATTPRKLSGETFMEQLNLTSGRKVSNLEQGQIMFRKRATIFRRNPIPNVLALLMPIIGSALAALLLQGYHQEGCTANPQAQSSVGVPVFQPQYLIGPMATTDPATAELLISSLCVVPLNASKDNSCLGSLQKVDSIDEFDATIDRLRSSHLLGGIYVGDGSSPPTIAYVADYDVTPAIRANNALNAALFKTSISTQYRAFDSPLQLDQGRSLQFCIYVGLAFAVFPAFFALYPSQDRLLKIRSLHYTNGVRPLPLWLAYLLFDFLFVLAGSIISIVILGTTYHDWYHLAYLFVVICLYGVTSILYAYTISLFVKSQSVMVLLSLITYLSVSIFAPANKIDTDLLILHFARAIISPSSSLMRGLFVSLNVFSIDCADRHILDYAGGITLYGGPILYLIFQSLLLFTIILVKEGGLSFKQVLRPNYYHESAKDSESVSIAKRGMRHRIGFSPTAHGAGLKVLKISKSFAKTVAVEDVSFNVNKGEVFALLGANGAGKSTTIDIIRGVLEPDNKDARIEVDGVSVLRGSPTARPNLGVCPQFDALDQMTVIEHLRFYGDIRGVKDVEQDCQQILHALDLTLFSNRLASKLSGGTKRRLSLGIALMGNPSVLLLDEPSSGLDIAAKRSLWNMLASVRAGRSIVLTIHSMEEVDALADHVGVMSKRMLAVGTTKELLASHGLQIHVHLIMKSAQILLDEMQRVRTWIQDRFPGAIVEERAYWNQIRFSIPVVL